MHSDYPITVNCWIKIPAKFSNTLGIFHGISKFLSILRFLVEPWLGNTTLDGHVCVEQNRNTPLD